MTLHACPSLDSPKPRKADARSRDRDCGPCGSRSQHALARSECLLDAVRKHQDFLTNRKRNEPMGNHDDDGSPLLEAGNRIEQCLLALLIEIGVGLVEYDEKGIAEKRAG